jgi:hypothetical protein
MDIAPQKCKFCFPQPFDHSGINQLSLHESRSTADDSLQVAQDSRIVATCNLLVKSRKRFNWTKFRYCTAMYLQAAEESRWTMIPFCCRALSKQVSMTHGIIKDFLRVAYRQSYRDVLGPVRSQLGRAHGSLACKNQQQTNRCWEE